MSKVKFQKLGSLLMVSLLLLGILGGIPSGMAYTTKVKVIPGLIELGSSGHENVVCTNFTFAVVIEDVTELWAFTVKIRINQTYFEYVEHTTTVPVEDYPNPIPPSPYAGILHGEPAAVTQVKDEYDPGTGILEVSYSTTSPSPSFNGSGTVCIVTLHVKDQPFTYEVADYIDIAIEFTETKLAGYGIPPPPISHDQVPGVVRLWSRTFVYPALPVLKVLGPGGVTTIEGYELGDSFTVDIWMDDLSPFWDPAGFDIYLHYNSTLINATEVTNDPDGTFAGWWPSGIYELFETFNNTAGYAHMAYIGVGPYGTNVPAFGDFRVASITFKVIYETTGYPPDECELFMLNPGGRPIIYLEGVPYECPIDIPGVPHPDRPMSPWNSTPYSVPIPHYVESALYKSPYKVLGAAIDVYTQYDAPFGGQGPHMPSDMFWPQKEVRLFAKVTYNLWPEQQKDVAFQIIDPHGAVYAVLCNRTDEDGVARVSFRLPWMCDDPEYYFGEWTVVATVDVACEHINDTLTFKYDYLVHIWEVTTDKSSYVHEETIDVTISYGSTAMQYYEILITVSVLDETGVPFAFARVWVTVGGAEYCTYRNGTTSVELYIPKWARAGMATIHVNALDQWPELGGVQHYPLVTEFITIRAE